MRIGGQFVCLIMSLCVASPAFALDMRDAPFLSNLKKKRIERDYRKSRCKESYTVAVSMSGAWGARCHSDASQDDVQRMALEKCEHTAQQSCGLVVINGKLVEYQESHRKIRYPKIFSAELVPFVRSLSRNRLKTEYERAADYRSLAISRNGSYGTSVGAVSEAAAKIEALKDCEEWDGNRGRCLIYAVGSEVVFRISTNIYLER